MLALAALGLGAYACWPRKADLRSFDPAGMARLETAMWRDYYDRHYPTLFYHLYEVSRTQFGFSPLDSVRIALAAAQAARTFQPTRSREAANAALPDLVTYYRLLASATSGGFDAAAAARHELDWWQARREAVGPRDYGVTVARVSSITYGRRPDDPAILAAGFGRAEAMAYRDSKGHAMAEQDWLEIEGRLLRAYQHLRTAIAGH
jgi:hypothetical protein